MTTDEQDRSHRHIAYFTMEVGLDSGLPTYAGGLGVLAGDMLRACADLAVPVVGITLLHRRGYFEQSVAPDGWQREAPVAWDPSRRLVAVPETASLTIEDRTVRVRAWRYDVAGAGGHHVPVYFLDTDLPENDAFDRALSGALYGGDERYRLAQEMVLGIGGVRLLRALGYTGIRKYHLNEGHAALATLELLREAHPEGIPPWPFDGIREQCVFTTHTPVPAGHDHFPRALAERALDGFLPRDLIAALGGSNELNMTALALALSSWVNGVAERHAKLSEKMFPGHAIHHVTNGVHSATWTAPSFRRLYDHHLPHWTRDASMLRNAARIPRARIWEAHEEAKAALLAAIAQRTGRKLRPEALTIGCARRATHYKRLDLVFTDVQRLLKAAGGDGRLQLVFAGKAHPHDGDGKEVIRRIIGLGRELGDRLPIVYLEDYDIDLAKLVVSGCDLWLNTPQRPLEASGTSGMKAAHNGVPSFSILDGWWLEGHVEGVTGWSIGGHAPEGGTPDENRADADDLYRKLEETILPLFMGARDRWIAVMQHAIALNASFFNTHRMIGQYAAAYLE
jgi:starch phosphorylase